MTIDTIHQIGMLLKCGISRHEMFEPALTHIKAQSSNPKLSAGPGTQFIQHQDGKGTRSTEYNRLLVEENHARRTLPIGPCLYPSVSVGPSPNLSISISTSHVARSLHHQQSRYPSCTRRTRQAFPHSLAKSLHKPLAVRPTSPHRSATLPQLPISPVLLLLRAWGHACSPGLSLSTFRIHGAAVACDMSSSWSTVRHYAVFLTLR